MSRRQLQIRSALDCQPLNNVRIERISRGSVLEEVHTDEAGGAELGALGAEDIIRFSKAGFVSKQVTGTTFEPTVRLLEDRLAAYQQGITFRPGEEVSLFVHAPHQFTAALYRHGIEKSRALELGSRSAVTQVIPDGYFVDRGPGWSETLRYQIPPQAKPGLYSLSLECQTGARAAVPMVVSTPVGESGKGARARVLVLASTNNWQAYNIWGGRSRYRNFESGSTLQFIQVSHSRLNNLRRAVRARVPKAIRAAGRRLLRTRVDPSAWYFQRLSVQRPMPYCGLEGDHACQPFTNHLAGGEWRVLAWLEREGIEYDIVSGFDLHREPSLLHGYSALILSTHCEYWSCAMYEGVKDAHEQHGLWLINLSGNTMYREVDFEQDGSMRCVSLSFAESCADETQLLGVRFSMSDYGTCAPYKIKRRSHWVFDGVPLANSDRIFGAHSLNQNTRRASSWYDPGRPGVEFGLKGMGASGWETDKLARGAPEDIVIVAKGMNPGGGADMVVRDPAGQRGGVFSASSILFGGSLLIDDVSSTVVSNVLRRAGVSVARAC